MSDSSSSSLLLSVESVCCKDLEKPSGPIRTGVGFLDHMVDQINSHGQIGVSIVVVVAGEGSSSAAAAAASTNNEEKKQNNEESSNDDNQEEKEKNNDRNRFAEEGDQKRLMQLVGRALGDEIKRLLENNSSTTTGSSSQFSCPLDEALVVCDLKRRRQDDDEGGRLASFALAPYGKYPPDKGRSRLGRMRTAALEDFWQSLACASGLEISLHKVRGDNAHHIVESSFKAFSRALRNLLDGTDTTITRTGVQEESSSTGSSLLLRDRYGPDSANWKESVALGRKSTVSRKTKETSIETKLWLDGAGAAGTTRVSTGISMLDDFLATMARECGGLLSLEVSCPYGDLWIDEHHTAEDVAITIGQAFHEALGNKAGLNRMWCASAKYGSSPTVQVIMDLSNRPCFVHNLTLQHDEKDAARDLSLEMFEHVLDSFVVNARWTVHIVEEEEQDEGTQPRHAAADQQQKQKQQQQRPESYLEDCVLAVATAMGRAIKYCCMVDTRRSGATASSKGTLSV